MDKVSPLGKLRQLAASTQGKRLPSVRELAARWGVSTRTVQEAVQEGVRGGWLQTKRGAGIWPQGALPAPVVRPARLDAGRLVEQIAEQIRHGLFAAGEVLPSPKDQAQQTGLHPATVRKAYQHLAQTRLIEHQGRVWRIRVPSPGHPSSPPVLVCLGAAGNDGQLRMDTDREWEFWREVQAEAQRCGLQPRLLPLSSDLSGLESVSHPFGAVFSNLHLPASTEVLDELRRRRIPTAIWAATEERLPGTRYRDFRQFWFHDLASGRRAGQTMGRHLASRGHRKVVWIGPFHGSAWSRNRLAGLREGLGEPVEVFEVLHDWISEWDVQVQIAWHPSLLERFDLRGLDDGGDPDHLRRPVVESLVQDRCLEILGPRLEEALAFGADLWVACSDLVARWCLRWLLRQGRSVPRDLALASFDDTREATRQNLTSLRFDEQGMARAMVRQVLSSRQEHRRLTRYDGQVVERRSTAESRIKN